MCCGRLLELAGRVDIDIEWKLITDVLTKNRNLPEINDKCFGRSLSEQREDLEENKNYHEILIGFADIYEDEDLEEVNSN